MSVTLQALLLQKAVNRHFAFSTQENATVTRTFLLHGLVLSIIYRFYWLLQGSQRIDYYRKYHNIPWNGPKRNWKQCLCKILGWQTKSIMVCYDIFCSGQLDRPDSPMAQFKTATIPCQLHPQKRPMLTDAQTAFEWQKEDVDTFLKVNSTWQKAISDLILAHHRRPTGSYSSRDNRRKFSFTLTLALLNLTVNFHREHSIVSTSCPWVSEDDPSLTQA